MPLPWQELSKLLDSGVDLLVPFHDDLVRIIHAELTLFFNALHALFLALAGLPAPGSHFPGVQPVGTPAALVLLLSRLAQLLSSSAIAKISAVSAWLMLVLVLMLLHYSSPAGPAWSLCHSSLPGLPPVHEPAASS